MRRNRLCAQPVRSTRPIAEKRPRRGGPSEARPARCPYEAPPTPHRPAHLGLSCDQGDRVGVSFFPPVTAALDGEPFAFTDANRTAGTADLPPVVWAALIRSAIRFTPAEASRSTSRPTMACSASIVGTVVWYQSPGPWLAECLA